MGNLVEQEILCVWTSVHHDIYQTALSIFFFSPPLSKAIYMVLESSINVPPRSLERPSKKKKNEPRQDNSSLKRFSSSHSHTDGRGCNGASTWSWGNRRFKPALPPQQLEEQLNTIIFLMQILWQYVFWVSGSTQRTLLKIILNQIPLLQFHFAFTF